MTGGSESAAGDKDGGTALIAQIPVGWQRKVDDGAVSYISPSGSVLRSVDAVRLYLRADGTCKCGLECPLVPHKVFNFDPAAMVQAPGHQSGKVEEDMTKLCNHRRKVDAMTALCQSMQPSHLPPPAPASGVVGAADGRTIGTHGDSLPCTYPQPKHNLPKSSIGFPLSSPRPALQNGSAAIARPPEQGSPLRKPQTQMNCASAYAKQQRNQRTSHNPASPNNVKQGISIKQDASFSSSPSSSFNLRATPSVNSPSPEVTFSPHQRSRHSSSSSLSDVFIASASSPMQSSPCSRLEGILQQYKDSGVNQNNQQLSIPDKRNGVSSPASGLLGLQILSQQKTHVNNSFPASSLLSAAAKAQLANQKTHPDSQNLDKEQQSKVLISTLNTSVHPTSSSRSQSLTALLLPHTSLSQNVTEKTLRRKRQRRSPTVLSLLKDPHSSRDPSIPLSPSLSPPSPLPESLRFPQNSNENRKPNLANSIPLSSPSPSQPLSALLQLLSMQNATQQPEKIRTSPIIPSESQNTRIQTPAQTAAPPSQTFPIMGEETTLNLKTTSSNAILNLSQTDPSGSVLINQMSSTSCLPAFGSKTTETFADHNTYQIQQANHNQALEGKGPVEAMDALDSRLLTNCDPSLSPSSDLPNPSVSLPLAEAFPFMSQDQLLQLLSSNAGLPSLLPPFLSSLPLGVFPQTQNSPLNILNQTDLPLNLVSLPASASPSISDAVEKPPGLQSLLMASLLLGQNPAAMLPLPLNLEQQVFADGVSLDKGLLDPVLMGPGILEALQTLAPAADGPSLLLSAPAPAFLSLSPAVLAAALAQSEPMPQHTPSTPPHAQGSLSSPALVSTSVSCAPLSGPDVCDPLVETDKNTHTPPFLPPLLAPGVLGELTALGNISGLHSLLGAGPLLLPHGPTLGVPLTQNHTALSPLACLQLTMAPGLMGEKHEAPDELPPAQISQDALQQPTTAQFDPYGSFMDTIYTSFLQVSSRGAEDPLPTQPSAPPSLSPRRACSVHNADPSRLGLDAAPSPARGTPKLSEDPSTPPPCRPAAAFLEEARLRLHSNGIGPGADAEQEEDAGHGEMGREDGADGDAEQAEDMRSEGRRGRKRKQSLQRVAEPPAAIASVLEEPHVTVSLSKPARPARGKRRRVLR